MAKTIMAQIEISPVNGLGFFVFHNQKQVVNRLSDMLELKEKYPTESAQGISFFDWALLPNRF